MEPNAGEPDQHHSIQGANANQDPIMDPESNQTEESHIDMSETDNDHEQPKKDLTNYQLVRHRGRFNTHLLTWCSMH